MASDEAINAVQSILARPEWKFVRKIEENIWNKAYNEIANLRITDPFYERKMVQLQATLKTIADIWNTREGLLKKKGEEDANVET